MKLSLQRFGRGMGFAVASLIVLNLTACSVFKTNPDGKAPTLAEKVAERVAAADKAQSQGKTDEAFDELNAATDIDPASKLPWVRKAQIHFDARMYGQAITAAQEALQRDNTDLTAKSILAVSGLRVSADAMEQLRKADEVKGSARSEAEAVAKIIREALGEPILLPPTAAGVPDPKAKPRARPRAVTPAPTEPAAPAAPVTKPVSNAKPAAQPAPAGGRSNPFGALQ
ncbi:MAG: tetratricopeptide repeat protein [Aquabacterium sp.]